MYNRDYFAELMEYASGIETIDTHEHLPGREEYRDKDTDIFREYLIHYLIVDLLSAGMTKDEHARVLDGTIPLMDRWHLLEPYWEASRNTGYCRALDISVRELYGVDKICRDTVEHINREFLRTLEPGHYRRVFKEKCRIRVSLLDRMSEAVDDCDREFFRRVYHMDTFIYPRSGYDIRDIERDTGTRIASFDNWLEACQATMEKALAQGAAALKCSLAYERPLCFERVSYNDAENDFNTILNSKVSNNWFHYLFKATKRLQDYMMHFVLELANRKNLTFQFHTGIQEGTGNTLANSDPSQMTNLFIGYPDVTFDIFHIGFPYQHTLSAIAKMFPNVFIDMCWAHIISPVACVNSLLEWIECMPAAKISAFGGDYKFVDGVIGHLHIARENVCKALALKVSEGLMDMDRARQLLKMFFFDNPLRIFKLGGDI